MVVSSPRAAYNRGEYKEALRNAEKIYIRDPSNAENLLLLAACHFQLNSIQESKFYAQQAVAIDRGASSHIAVGRCFVEVNQSLAEEFYSKAVRLQPRFAEAYGCLGCLRLRQHGIKEAIDCFDMAISLKQYLVEAASNLAYALALNGDVDAAKRVLQKSKQSPIILLNYGNLYHIKGDFNEAIQCYLQALKLEPTFYDAEINLSASLIELYKASKNKAALEDALSRLERLVNSGVKRAHANLGVCQALLGMDKMAVHQLKLGVLFELTNIDALCNLAGLFFKDGNLQESTHLCFRALTVKPDSSQAFNILGLTMIQLGNGLLADKCFQTAQKLQPNKSYSQVYMGAIMLHQGQPIAAARMFKKAIASDPYMTSAFLNLGNGE